jgi:hypothetical protein
MGFWAGSRYFATGAPEAVTTPGEYFLDVTRGYLYALPPPGVAHSEFNGNVNAAEAAAAARLGLGPELTQAVEVLAVTDARRVWVSGLRLSGSRGTLAVIANCTDVRVQEMRLWGSGAAAVNAHFDLNRNIEIVNNSVLDTATFSLWLAGGE